MTEAEKIAITKYDLYYESRMTKVESGIEELRNNMKEIRTDFRWLVLIMIGGFGGLFGFMAHGFKWF